jgi:hypothetical protein
MTLPKAEIERLAEFMKKEPPILSASFIISQLARHLDDNPELAKSLREDFINLNKKQQDGYNKNKGS